MTALVLVVGLLVTASSTPPLGTPLLAPPSLPPPPAPAPVEVTSVEGDASDPPTQPEPTHEESYPLLGLQLDAGLPGGFGASAVLRLWGVLRFHAGALDNTVSPGFRAGASFTPFHLLMSPTVTFEGGHLFAGNMSNLLKSMAKKHAMPAGLLDNTSYDFYSLYLGIELGWARRFVFYLRGGLSYLDVSMPGPVQDLSNASRSAKLNPGIVKLTSMMPTEQAGFILYLD